MESGVPALSNKRLYDLQELDWALSADEASLKEVRARLEDESEINAARARLQKLTAELDKRAPLRRTLESSLARLEERLQAAEQRLYGGAVTNPRELSASEEERRLLQEQRGAEEDRMLDVMVDIEELQSSRDATQELLGRLETDREAEYADLLQRQDALVVRIDELRRGRQRITPEIPVAMLSVYESLIKTRGGHAVAKVERGLCQGCRLALPTMENQRAKSSQGIVQCSSCRRILYVE
jgi:predicted  nucleic acid-binding Zn-ribbon protein